MSEEFFTVLETAEKLSVSPRTIQRYCKQGLLNYKWVDGKRHKELRIIPPIPVSKLPSANRRKGVNIYDFVTKTVFENSTEELKRQLLEKDRRIDFLVKEVAQLKSVITQRPISLKNEGNIEYTFTELAKKAESLLSDFEKVRPLEKKLILKMAKEIQAIGEFLRSLRLVQPEHDDSLTK